MVELSSAYWLRRMVLATVLIMATAGTLSAQTHGFTPKRGFTPERGPLAAAAGDELRRVEDQGAVRIERRKNDSVLNGALIGAAAGVGTGIAYCLMMEPWEICNDPGSLSLFGALGAGIGIGIDALIREREVIYKSENSTGLHVAPMVGRGTKGVRLGVRF